MIVPMKKLSLLLYHKERESFLTSLQDLGVVHIEENPEVTSEDLETLQGNLKTSDSVIKSLNKIEKELLSPVSQEIDGNAEEIIEKFDECEQQIEKIDQKIASLQKDIKALSVWGNFEPSSVERLKNSGINLRFFELTEKKFDELNKDGFYFEVINRQSGTVFFTAIEKEKAVSIDADEIILPKISLGKAEQQVGELESQKATVNSSLQDLVRYKNIIQNYFNVNSDSRGFEAARINMQEAAEGKLLLMTGWLPLDNEKKVAEFLDKYSSWYQFSEPTKDDKIPVKLKNRKTWKLFEPILKIYSLPDYFEIDPVPFFAPFFAFFFGLCLADFGYGILLLIISGIGLAKVPKNLKPFMFLGLILGFCTLIGGFILNTFFGHPIFATAGAETGYFKSGVAWALLTPVVTEAGTYFPAMPFAMYIGVLQILVGTVMRMVNQLRNEGFMYTLHPFASFLMICGVTVLMAGIDFVDMGKFTFGSLQLGPMLQSIPMKLTIAVIFTGLGILFLFNNPNKIIPVRLGMGLWELYQFGSGLMADALSYLRLFALGLAGGLLGAAFNQIAFMFILTKEGTVNYANPLIICTILVLIIGHSLNFILAALGSFVHPLRLTFVEFYNNVVFKGGGQPFTPFSKVVKQ